MHKSLSLEVIGEGANTIKNIKLASGAKVIVSKIFYYRYFFIYLGFWGFGIKI